MSGGGGTLLRLEGLGSAVSLRDVGDYCRRHGVRGGRRWSTIAIIVAIYLTGQAAFLWFLLPAAGLDEELLRNVFAGFVVATGLYAVWLGAVIWRNAARPVRIERAALANGMAYDDRQPGSIPLAGSVANHSSFTFATDFLYSDGATTVPFVAATLGPRPGTTLRRNALAIIALERQTPHIVLENRRAGVLRTTGTRFRGYQRLSLEGDFDRYFHLFCPRGYETDALYIFTPDVMAVMIDLAGDCEAELVDGSLVLYSRRPWRLWRARHFAALVELISVVGAKTRSQTSRYLDPRGTGGAVAASGRRLRVRPSLGAVLSTAVPVVFVALGIVSWFAG